MNLGIETETLEFKKSTAEISTFVLFGKKELRRMSGYLDGFVRETT